MMSSRPAPRSPQTGRPTGPRGAAPGPAAAPAPARGLSKGRLLPEGTLVFLKRRLREAGGLGILGFALALSAALASYNSRDPSFSTAVPNEAALVRNMLGLPGAYTADLLWQTLGFAAFSIVFIAGGWGLSLLRHRAIRQWPWRILAAMLTVLLSAMLLIAITGAPAAGGSAGLMLINPLARLAGDLLGVLALPVLALTLLLPFLLALLAALGIRLSTARDWLTDLRGWWKARKAAASAAPAPATRWTDAPADDHPTEAPAGLLARWRDGLAGLKARLPGRRAATPVAAPISSGSRAAPSFGTMPPVATDELPLAAPPPPPAPAAPASSGAEERRRPAPVVERGPKPILPDVARKMEKARQPGLPMEAEIRGDHELPPVDIMQMPPPGIGPAMDEAAIQRNAEMLETVLDDFGVRGQIVKVSPGPVVTLYELEPAPGVKSARVIGLADDIARSMSAVSVRVAVVPGRNVIGIEMPNQRRETVYLRELLMSDAYEKSQQKLALILGKDIGGGPIIADLARMPHLLVAGTTGSGKSVAINTMILSLLYRLPPDKCRFIMVDPKMLELSIYEGIPHLLAPVVTDPKKAVVALKWAVREMEDRYRNMSKLQVRNIDGYNARLREARQNGEILTRRVQTGFDPDTGKPIFEEHPLDLTELPYIVVIVDEMADLMLVAGKDIEAAIQRLAQMARAAGIHLIMATQRPSVDVITGTIKANFPTRISFQVTSKIDSRTILGEQGAEQLLGQGDMLYMAGGGRITRVHGPFVRDEEVEQVVRFLKAQGEPAYVDAVTEEEDEEAGGGDDGGSGGGGTLATGDDLYDQAVAVVTKEGKASTSFIQRHLRIGYNSAARLIERMEKEGVISKANHAGKREVLARNIDDNERVN
ncbi:MULTISPECIES: DNA translocase FtsK [unclassified Azospirillum]|uniref:DNA translocase FtsK n=1 Tax=unclassified Azospirillum TaxID=2630922 RepID=UPI001FCE28BD|nr:MULTISPECIES: DNA translocase FtsK [unclassified Azospirillum]